MIILCAALKIADVVIPCCRHSDGWEMIFKLNVKIKDDMPIADGFITTENEFLTREEAFKVAMSNGQLSEVTRQHKIDNLEHELYSEDLY